MSKYPQIKNAQHLNNNVYLAQSKNVVKAIAELGMCNLKIIQLHDSPPIIIDGVSGGVAFIYILVE